jgi:hypothetical protein
VNKAQIKNRVLQKYLKETKDADEFLSPLDVSEHNGGYFVSVENRILAIYWIEKGRVQRVPEGIVF